MREALAGFLFIPGTGYRSSRSPASLYPVSGYSKCIQKRTYRHRRGQILVLDSGISLIDDSK